MAVANPTRNPVKLPGPRATITPCTANNYCPGGESLDDPTNTGLKACPANTESVAGSDAKGKAVGILAKDARRRPGFSCAQRSRCGHPRGIAHLPRLTAAHWMHIPPFLSLS